MTFYFSIIYENKSHKNLKMEKDICMYPGETTPTFRYKWWKGDSKHIIFRAWPCPHYAREIWKWSFLSTVRPIPSTLIHHKNGPFWQHSSNRRNLKTLIFHFRNDRKHFENRAFQKWCHRDNKCDFPAQVFLNHESRMTGYCCICVVWTKTSDGFPEWNLRFQIPPAQCGRGFRLRFVAKR